MKKILSILVVVALMAAFLVTSALAAEGDPQIVVSSVTASAGETVTLTVSLKNNPGITNGKITIEYDANVLEPVTGTVITAGDLANGATVLSSGYVMNFVAPAGITGDGVLFSVTLKVKADATGTGTVKAVVSKMKNSGADVAFTAVDGVVTVGSNTPEHTCAPTDVAEVPATCTTNGTKAHQKCACGKLFLNGVEVTADALVIPAGHTLTDVAEVPATCTTNGTKAHKKCSVCSKLFVDGKEVTAADLVIAKAAHEMGEWAQTKAPTETEKGEETRKCKNCTHTETREVAALGHTCAPVDVAEVKATCTAEGTKAHEKCACGKLFVDGKEVTAADLVIAKAAHEMGEWTQTKAPTETEKGEESRKCKNCDHTEKREVATLGHTCAPVDVAEVPATCDVNGTKAHKKCACGKLYIDGKEVTAADLVIPAKHGNLVHMDAIAPGCHYDGVVEHWICYTCERVWTDEALTKLSNIKNVIVPATGGKIVHVEAKENNCYENGNIEYWYCEECEQVWQNEALTQLTNFKRVILGALNHCNLVHMEAVAPGCHYEGLQEHWYCPDCETVWSDEALTQITNHKNVIIPATGGNVVHFEAIEPGCHYDGNIEYWVCYECEQVWQNEALTQLTNIKSVILPAKGGEVVHVEAKVPTCLENGNIEHWYCEECEQVWQDEARTQLTNFMRVIAPALGHNYVNGTCTNCGDVPETGDTMISVAVAAVLISAMSIVALPVIKKRF